KTAAHAPFLDQPLPYEYGYNITNGTPLYKSVPSREERVKLEPWLKPRPKIKPVVQAVNDVGAAGVTTPPAGVAPAPANATPQDPLGLDSQDAGVPWYLRDFDGGKPQI